MGMAMALTAILAVSAATGALLPGCANPVESEEIAALGDTNVRNGPTHRPGQPCLVCHDGGVSPEFYAAGTVFSTPEEKIGVTGAVVTITDAAGHTEERTTNCAGNFYLDENSTPLQFPLHVEVQCTLPDGTVVRNVMGTRVDRDGACAGCHKDSPSQSSTGRVACVQKEPAVPFTASTSCN